MDGARGPQTADRAGEMLTPLDRLGVPGLLATQEDLWAWQPWAAAVLGALAALDRPLDDASPEQLLAYFHPLVAGAAALLVVVRNESQEVAVAWDAVALQDDAVHVCFVDGRSVL